MLTHRVCVQCCSLPDVGQFKNYLCPLHLVFLFLLDHFSVLCSLVGYFGLKAGISCWISCSEASKGRCSVAILHVNLDLGLVVQILEVNIFSLWNVFWGWDFWENVLLLIQFAALENRHLDFFFKLQTLLVKRTVVWDIP